VPSVDADRHVAGDGRAAHHAVLVAIVIEGIVLGCLIVPDRDVAACQCQRTVFSSRVTWPCSRSNRRADSRLEWPTNFWMK
jgi:hypothetical protein